MMLYKDKTLLLLKEQYNLSKKLYFDYLLNLMPECWSNIYNKILLKNNKLVLNLNNIFNKINKKKMVLNNSLKINKSLKNNKLENKENVDYPRCPIVNETPKQNINNRNNAALTKKTRKEEPKQKPAKKEEQKPKQKPVESPAKKAEQKPKQKPAESPTKEAEQKPKQKPAESPTKKKFSEAEKNKIREDINKMIVEDIKKGRKINAAMIEYLPEMALFQVENEGWDLRKALDFYVCEYC